MQYPSAMQDDPHHNPESTVRGQQARRIYTVSVLNAQIKKILDEHFPLVWITGEISNLFLASSGHIYCTLKDEHSQISAVMFRANRRQMGFDLEDGLSIVAMGRVSVYDRKGAYQIYLEYVEPAGIGALQLQFEQMRKRLEAEGLFEGHYKKPIPYLPETIGIITSSKGAVIHDILTTIDQRFPNRSIRIVSVKVQGAEAADEIANAIGIFNQNYLADVIVIARGGGSMEDLQPFNTETVARAIFESDIPIVSAVGHESDFSICDFVSDLRAPTPTAAAEMVVPKKRDLILTISSYKRSLQASMNRQLARVREMVNALHSRIKHPIHKIGDLRVHLDNLLYRASISLNQRIRFHRVQVEQNHKQLHSTLPVIYLHDNIFKVATLSQRAQKAILSAHRERTLGLKQCSMVLQALNPLRVLERGYSITCHPAPNGQVVTNAESVATGQELEIILAKGLLKVKITDKNDPSS